MALTVGARLGPYEILSALGAGGMGEVYRARDTKLGRDVALKILSDAFTHDPERLARFRREAQVLAALNHPHIGAIYGLDEANGTQFLALELVDGESLDRRIARGAIPVEEALGIARQIAEALEAAHEKGIIHRDLKPANIALTKDGSVKVLDFGLAKATGAASDASINLANSPTITSPAMMTGVGVILGTAAYMAPEQAAGGVADKRSDLWAFGVVLMEMLTGRPVFTGETVSHVLASVLKSEPDWTTLPVETPTPLRRLLRRCLEKNRKRRLSDASDARLEIEEAASGTADAAPAALPARAGRREAFAWALAGLAIAAAVSVAAWHALTRPAAIPVAASQFVVPAPEHLVYRDAPAISPDGRTIAFVAAAADGRSNLWVRPLDVLTARALTGTDGAVAPFWSPDSRSIGFFAQGELKKTDASGGAPQILASIGGFRNRAGSWNRDGIILFSESTNRTMRVPAVGGAVASVITGSYPFFLPDGRHFLFFLSDVIEASGAQFSGQGIYVGALDSPETKLVALADSAGVYASPGFLLFSRGGTLMAQPFDAVHLTTTGDAVPIADRVQVTPGFRQVVSVAEDGTLLRGTPGPQETRLEWVNRRGAPVALAAAPAIYMNMALSPDATRVAFDRVTEGSGAPDVWLLDLARHVTTRFTFNPNVDNVPVWSPDGRTVAFASNAGTSNAGSGLNIAQRPANASGPPQVLLKLDAPPIMYPSDWSSDGRFLAYFRADPQTKLDLWVVPLSGDRKPMPLLHSEFNESQGQFSPDGRWMAYVSDESGTPQVYVQSFPTLTGNVQVSPDGGTQPRWRRDGKELFYLAPDRKLMAVTVNTGDVFEAEAPHALFDTTLPPESTRQSYSVSADGQRFLLSTRVDTDSSPFTIVLNWTGLLKR